MTTYAAELLAASTPYRASSIDAHPAFLVIAAGGALPPETVTHYVLGCYDTLGARVYWTSTSASLSGAPSGHTYVASTLTVIGSHQ
jgi:hypothetical protein